MAKTTASFTLMDYTDGISLISSIQSNLPLICQYDKENNKINPSWKTKNLNLTPQVIKAGGDDITENLTSKAWKYRYTGNSWQTITSGSNGFTINTTNGALSVTQDMLTGSYDQVDFQFTASYTDPTLQLLFPVELVVSFSRVYNGTSFVIAQAVAVNGNQFKNKEPSELTLEATLIRGAADDTTGVSYQWAKSVDGHLFTDLTGKTSRTLTIYPSDVPNGWAMFRCKIKDTDTTSVTHDGEWISDAVSILDMTDPYYAVIESTNGYFFKKNSSTSVTTTILICRVFQNGKEVDETGADLTYTWSKTDKDGNSVTSFSPKAVAVTSQGIVDSKSKAIEISSSDVNTKANFFCEVN